MVDSFSQIEPIHWFIFMGIVSVAVARYGTHLVMPDWIAFSLRWGGWILIAFGILVMFGVFDAFFDMLPI